MKLERWPVSKLGEEAFIGYPVAIGTDEALGAFLECEYNGKTRYILPADLKLVDVLFGCVKVNIEFPMEYKIWIKKTDKGWEVELP